MDPALYAESRIGATLRGKWTLESLLGVGGMAAVYVGVHKIGQRAAIKILHPDLARSAELRARFEQEAHAVNRFKHAGVVEIRDIDVTEDGAPFLVMELLDGASLAEHADRPAGLALAEVLRLVDDLLDVLVAAHAQGIVHRDIKPDNLFVTRDGRLKVLDFGIARVKDGIAELRTRAGAMLGTTPYMAPEQILGKDIDARVDVFAVGATMFRLLTGRRIHEAGSEAELLIKMATVPAPPLLSVAPGVPREVGAVVDRALALDREQRYPDAAAMQRAVQEVRAGKAAPAADRTVAAPAADRTVAAAPDALHAAAVAVVATLPPAIAAVRAPEPLARTEPARPGLTMGPGSQVGGRRPDEVKVALIFVLGLILVLALTLMVALLLRPTPTIDPAAPATPPTDDPGDPSARDPGDPPPVDLGPPPRPGPGPGPGRGKGHGHGKGKH